MISSASQRRSRRARFVLLSVSTILCSGLSAPAFAQTTPTPERPITDLNGVDLATGTFAANSKSISVGNLSFQAVWNGTVDETTFTNLVFGSAFSAVVFVEGKSLRFLPDNNGIFQPELANGATLTPDQIGGYVYTAPNGTRYEFVASVAGTVGMSQSGIGNGSSYARLSKITYPNGETRTWNYRIEQVQSNCTGTWHGMPIGCTTTTYQRPQSVTTNTGLMLKTTFASNTPGSSFNTLTGVTAINLGVDYCDPAADQCTSLTHTWPTLAISQTTDNTGLVQKVFASPSGEFWARLGANGPTEVNQDNAGNSDFTVTRYPDGKIYQVTNDGVTTTYTYTQSGSQLTVTRTRPNSMVDTYVIDAGATSLTSKTDALGRTTSYDYDSQGRLYKTTFPEGNQTILTYDPVGRVTETRRKAKPGSSLADIVETAGYVTNCTVETLNYCMKPLWTVDARGNRTDYTYSADHGEVTKVQLPAPSTGQSRPEMDYTYTQLYAKVLNASGVAVDGPTAVWKLTGITSCPTAATCSGSVAERKTSIAYGTGMGGMNLMPTQITVGSGDNTLSATTTYSYDASDNVIAIDGPRAGTSDTTYYFWDADNRPIGEIGPDPDGAGPLSRRARRYTYTGNNLTKTEIGTAAGIDATALAGMTVLQTSSSTYDANDYKLTDAISSGGTTYALTQYSYDSAGRLECSAVRMNVATYTALPSSACTTATTGSYGPDRITRTTYDAGDQPTKVQTAYATADQADEATASYNTNGTLATLTDAQGNKTSYVYDGVDRLSQTFYPSTTVGSGTSSTTDYEQLGYDPAGNVTSRRLRDGNSIGYGYDADGRLTSKNLPGTEPDISYSYDNFGRVASVTDTNSNYVNLTYDALNRLVAQSTPLGSVGMGYDAAGRRTATVWPDSFYVTYDHLVTGEVSAIRENGATSGIGVLATYSYDDLGRRTSLLRGNGTSTSYAYDNVSRLTSLALDMAGTSADHSVGFSYNPSGQITSTTRSNDIFAWTASVNRNDASSVNGLNQVTSIGAGSIGYDSKGNLNSTGSNSYTYSSENLLLAGPSSASLTYDPLARLYQETVGGVATRFQYDGQAMIGEYDASGVMQKRYVHGPGVDEPLIEYDKSGGGFTRAWLHADERGSIVAQSNDSGANIAVNSYDEFGVPASGNVGRFQYTGQTWLSSMGLYNYKARIYSPRAGRFLQTDPIGYNDGLNWYNYVGSDPINGRDPLGLDDDVPDVVVVGKRENNVITVTGFPTSSFVYNFAPSYNYGSGPSPFDSGNGTPPDVIVKAKKQNPKKKESILGDFKGEISCCELSGYGFNLKIDIIDKKFDLVEWARGMQERAREFQKAHPNATPLCQIGVEPCL